MHDVDNKKWTIHRLPESDRPREKALEFGIEALTVSELLAIIIGSGSPGESVIELSHRILQHYDGSLRRLSMASASELKSEFRGVGDAKAITIKAAIRLAHLYAEEKYVPAKITSPVDAYNFMRFQLEPLPHEEFWVVCLNNARKVITKLRISKGGIASTVVDLRIILKHAIVCGATGMVLYHNHPSGIAFPSADDDKLTANIVAAARTVNIPVVDHIIIYNGGFYSYLNEGKL